jgi:hypothetical protein
MAVRARIVDEFDPAQPRDGVLVFVSTTLDDPLDHHLLAQFETAGPISLASLRRATDSFFRRMERDSWFGPGNSQRVTIGLRNESADEFLKTLVDAGNGHVHNPQFHDTPRPTAIHLDDEWCSVSFSLRRGEETDTREAEAVLAPFLKRLGATAKVSSGSTERHEVPGFKIEVEIRPKFHRGATLLDAWRIGEDAAALIEVVEGDEIPRSMALDLLRSGRWGVFKGQPELDWFEAKGAPYAEANRHLGKNWKYELAKDVAAFANSPEGGFIVIGMTTEDEGDGEVITGFREFDLKRVTAGSYGNYVAQHVYPRVEGFEVVRLPGRERGRGIAALVIPRQDPSNLPFLVRGLVRDGEILGSHVLWPVRLGDQTAILDANGLHARLRLGDQVIKGTGRTGPKR